MMEWMRGPALAALLLFLAAVSGGCGVRQRTVVFNENLDETVLELDGREYALRELAFYVAYEEGVVQEQALAYDADDTEAYWNTHMNGHFMRLWARDMAMDQAVHDFIFYEKALELGVELDREEEEYAAGEIDDFWMDLGEYGQSGLGVTREELGEDMMRMALSQKCQQLLAAMRDLPPEDFDVGGAAYEKELESHEYEIKKSVWEGIKMGRVTLEGPPAENS